MSDIISNDPIITTSQERPLYWPHAPLHRYETKGTYMITAGTYLKEHFFKSPDRLTLLQNTLIELADEFKWHLQAWAIFSNHYHFIGTSPIDASNLRKFLTKLHGQTARTINVFDQTPGRQVWHQFWDTHLTFQKSYLARLNYVIQNPVKHGLVRVANQYPWCSAKWFEGQSTTAFRQTLLRFDPDKVNVYDDFYCV